MNNEYKDEIDLIDLFWKIMYSWRAILVAMLIGAVAIGLGKYAMDARTAAKNNAEVIRETEMTQLDKETTELEKQTSLEDKLTEEELNAVLEAANAYKTLFYKEDYYNKSIYMNIDPYNRYTTYMWYRVELNPDQIKYTAMHEVSILSINELNDLTSLYCEYATSRGIQEKLTGVLGEGVDVKYISEIMGSGISTTGVFYISIFGQNAKQTETIAKQVDKLIQQYQSNLADSICGHTLTKVDEYTGIAADSSLATVQENYRVAIINLRKNIVTLTKGFSSDQKKLYDKYTAKTVNSSEYSDTVINDVEINNTNLESNAEFNVTVDKSKIGAELEKANLSVKYIILGAFVGIVLCAGWIASVYVFSSKIKDSKHIQNRYGLRVLGDVEVDVKKTKPFAGVDCLMDKLRKKEVVSMEAAKQMLLVNIKLLIGRNDIRTLMLTSSSIRSDNEKAFVTEIMDLCKKSNVECVYEENLTRNVQAVEDVAKMGNVILLTKEGQTTMQVLENEIRVCREQNAEVLGVINLL